MTSEWRCILAAMWKMIALALLLLPPALSAQTMTATQLIALAEKKDAGLADAIQANFKAEDLKSGTAFTSHLTDFFFATQSITEPKLLIDDAPGPQMKELPGTNLWFGEAKLGPLASLHSYRYVVNGSNFGGSSDVPVYGPLAYSQPNVPAGKLSDRIVHTSKIYDGMKSDYWIYVPAQYDAKVPAALMVFQDGRGYTDRQVGEASILNVIDNLIAQHKIPVMICVFINPGTIAGSPGTPTYNFVKAYSDKWHRRSTIPCAVRSTTPSVTATGVS